MDIQTITIGGGGFSMEPQNLLLEEYILNSARSARPRVCFVPTASGDSETYIEAFYTSFTQLGAVPSHLQLFRLTIRDIRAFLLQQDVIYVGGGNTFNMLLIWKERGIDAILRQAAENGTLLCGLSAGSICWFQSGSLIHWPRSNSYRCSVSVDYREAIVLIMIVKQVDGPPIMTSLQRARCLPGTLRKMVLDCTSPAHSSRTS